MARLNTRPRSPSRSPSTSPSSGNSSDQENRDPVARRMDKGKRRAVDTPRQSSLPTPSSEGSESARGQKRKRAPGQLSNNTLEDEGSDEEPEDDQWFRRFFDPNQDPEERRDVKKRIRALERDFQETRDDLLRESNGGGLTTTINRANKIFQHVKQTNDATVDSRLLVNVSDIAYKKAAQLVLGDTSTGIDVDEFLSKCITFMRNGGPLDRETDTAAAPTQRRRGVNRDDSDDEGDEEDINGSLDWETLGCHACYPYNSRPAVPSFLLGPLSVEKKQRKETQRRARNARDTAGREARPEELTKESLQQSDEGGLTAICTRLRNRLENIVQTSEAAFAAAGFETVEDLKSSQGKALLRKHRFTDAGGVSLFHYTINPRSFGQSVENLFYVSFLIREGNIGIVTDSAGIPTIVLAEVQTLAEKRQNDAKKNQAVFSLDYSTWQNLIEALEIEECLIPHREEDEAAYQVPQTGWYT